MLTLASQKGGPGRSLLAIHLAVYAEAHGVRTVRVDADPQETAGKWYDRRESATPSLVTASAGALHEVLDAARQGGYALAVIDTPPHAAAQIDEAAQDQPPRSLVAAASARRRLRPSTRRVRATLPCGPRRSGVGTGGSVHLPGAGVST